MRANRFSILLILILGLISVSQQASADFAWCMTIDGCMGAPRYTPEQLYQMSLQRQPAPADVNWIHDHPWITFFKPELKLQTDIVVNANQDVTSQPILVPGQPDVWGHPANICSIRGMDVDICKVSYSYAATWGKNLLAIAPSLVAALNSGDYSKAFSIASDNKIVGLLASPTLWNMLGANPLTPSQMQSFYEVYGPTWNSHILKGQDINNFCVPDYDMFNNYINVFEKNNPAQATRIPNTFVGNGTWATNDCHNMIAPMTPSYWLDNGSHLPSAANANSTIADGDNKFPDMPRFMQTDVRHQGAADVVVQVGMIVGTAVMSAGAGSAFTGVLVAETGATGVAATAISVATNTVVSGTLNTAENGGSFGQNLLSSLEGAAVGQTLAPVTGGIATDLGKAGVNQTVANYTASLATGTASGAIMNGGNFNQAFVGAATGAGIGALTNGLENYSNSQQSSYSAADARNAYVNGDSMNGLTVSNNFQSANLQPLSIAQLNQNVGAVDLSNIPMPVVNLPEVSASGSAYSLPADIQAMAGLTDLNQANLNSSLGLSAGLGGTAAAGALGLGYIQSTGTSSAAIGEVSIDVKPVNSSYADINWTMPKPRDGIATIYDPNAGGMNSSIWYSIDSADNVVSTDYISIGKVVGDPARPGLGQYLLTAVAEQNPGMPIFGDIGLTNGQAFKSAFLQLATSDQPLTASAVADALSQVPAIRSLPGTVEILPQFDSMGNLTKVGILRYPDLSSSSATVTNIDSLLGDTNFQNWISALPTQPVSYFNTNGSYALKTPIMSNANAGGGLSSGLRTAQGGFVDTSVFADGLDTLGNFARAAAPVALDGLNVGLTAWSAVDTLYPVAQAAIPQYQQNLNQLSTAVQNCSGIGCIGVNQSYDANSQALGNAMMIQMAGDYITHPAEAWIQGELQAFDNSTMQATNAENQAWANLAQSNSATNDLPTLPTVTITAPRPSTVSMIGANIANAVSTAYNTIASRVTSAFSSPAPAANAAVPAAISSTNRAPASMTQFRPAVSAMRPSTVGRIVSAPVARPTFVAPNLRRNNLYR